MNLKGVDNMNSFDKTISVFFICFALMFLGLLFLLVSSLECVAQDTFDPGYDDIEIQPIGTSIKRCQFSDKAETTSINGIDVPNWIQNPQVSYEQYKFGDAEKPTVCFVPMIRGQRKSGTNGNGKDLMVDYACFIDMECTS